jgi:hypothetical protein
MRKNPNWILALCIGAFANGCATYQEPSAGSIAQIRFVTSGAATVETFDPANCAAGRRTRIASLGALLNSSGRKKMGLPLGTEFEDQRLTEVNIPADQSFYFSMGVAYGNSVVTSCRIDMRLDPSPGRIYEAAFEYRDSKCRMEVNEIVAGGEGKYRRMRTPAATQHECRKN